MTLIYIGIILSFLGLVWTIYGVFSSKKLKKSIISEKNMILDKISGIKRIMQSHLDKIYTDRKSQNDQTLNTVHIREEDIKALRDNLENFEERLKEIK